MCCISHINKHEMDQIKKTQNYLLGIFSVCSTIAMFLSNGIIIAILSLISYSFLILRYCLAFTQITFNFRNIMHIVLFLVFFRTKLFISLNDSFVPQYISYILLQSLSIFCEFASFFCYIYTRLSLSDTNQPEIEVYTGIHICCEECTPRYICYQDCRQIIDNCISNECIL